MPEWLALMLALQLVCIVCLEMLSSRWPELDHLAIILGGLVSLVLATLLVIGVLVGTLALEIVDNLNTQEGQP